MTIVDQYIKQVSLVRPLNLDSGIIDIDLLEQLQEEDTPRLVELVRSMQAVLQAIQASDDPDIAEFANLATVTLNQCEELASDGLMEDFQMERQ
jgi:hypothetical protein